MSFRKITVKSGNEEFTLEVTEEEYQKYYRPWWSQRKREQRNREAMVSLPFCTDLKLLWLPVIELTDIMA